MRLIFWLGGRRREEKKNIEAYTPTTITFHTANSNPENLLRNDVTGYRDGTILTRTAWHQRQTIPIRPISNRAIEPLMERGTCVELLIK